MTSAPLLNIKIEGLQRAVRGLDRESKGISNAFACAVYLFACDMITRAMRITPVATGHLRRSRYVTKPDDPMRFVIESGFSATYAWFVENINARHRVGQSHFFSSTVQAAAARAAQQIEAMTWKLFAAGATIDKVNGGQPGLMAGPEPTRLLAQRRARQQSRRRQQGRSRVP